METVLVVCFGVLMVFCLVVLVGAPYLPTTSAQRHAALTLLDLKPGQHLLELGAGDGAMVIEALRQGLRVTAVEINPILCGVIYIRTLKYRGRVKIVCANFWTTKWPEVDGIYVFLLDKYMKKLDKKIIQQNISLRLASYAFKIPGKKPTRELRGVFRYDYA